jgi:hypothetical protein
VQGLPPRQSYPGPISRSSWRMPCGTSSFPPVVTNSALPPLFTTQFYLLLGPSMICEMKVPSFDLTRPPFWRPFELTRGRRAKRATHGKRSLF